MPPYAFGVPVAPVTPARDYAEREFMPPAPAASGSLTQAWLSIATRMSRANIAAWSQAGDRSWTTNSLIAVGVIGGVFSLVSGLIFLVANYQLPSSTFSVGGHLTFHPYGVANLVTTVVESLIGTVGLPLAVAFFLALFMSPAFYGTLGERFQRALKPVALGSVGVAVVVGVFGIVSAGIALAEQPALQALAAASANSSNPNTAALQASLGPFLGFSCLTLLATAGFAAYGLSVVISTGGVGANKSRGVAFGIALLGGIAFAIVDFLLVQLPLMLTVLR